MTWAAVGSAGIGAAAGLGGSMMTNSGPEIQPMDAIPNHLKEDYKKWTLGIDDLQGPQYWQGDQIAGQNPWTLAALEQMGGYGDGRGGDMANQLYGVGQQALGGIGQGMDYLQGMQERGPHQFAYDQNTFDQSFNNLTGGLQDQFDMGALQMQQGFDWGQLKGLNMNNALGGGQGSTKFGQESALGQAMTNQNIQQFGSNLWMNAVGQADANAMSGGARNLASMQGFDQDMLSGYGKYGQMGADMFGMAQGMDRDNMGLGLEAGNIQQGYDQSLIDADIAKWNYEQNEPWETTQRRLSMIPQPAGASGIPVGMNPLQGAMYGAQTGLGIYGAGKDAGWWGQGDIGVGDIFGDNDTIYGGGNGSASSTRGSGRYTIGS